MGCGCKGNRVNRPNRSTRTQVVKKKPKKIIIRKR